jgi:hypothetical protein
MRPLVAAFGTAYPSEGFRVGAESCAQGAFDLLAQSAAAAGADVDATLGVAMAGVFPCRCGRLPRHASTASVVHVTPAAAPRGPAQLLARGLAPQFGATCPECGAHTDEVCGLVGRGWRG